MDDSIRTGKDRVPPGQYVTDKWPVLTYGDTPEVEPEEWALAVSGLVAAKRTFSWREFQSLPRVGITADFHCRFSHQETREAYQVRRRARELGLVPGK